MHTYACTCKVCKYTCTYVYVGIIYIIYNYTYACMHAYVKYVRKYICNILINKINQSIYVQYVYFYVCLRIYHKIKTLKWLDTWYCGCPSSFFPKKIRLEIRNMLTLIWNMFYWRISNLEKYFSILKIFIFQNISMSLIVSIFSNISYFYYLNRYIQ